MFFISNQAYIPSLLFISEFFLASLVLHFRIFFSFFFFCQALHLPTSLKKYLLIKMVLKSVDEFGSQIVSNLPSPRLDTAAEQVL